MRHGIKKIKFSHGRDSNKNMVRKLVVNFVNHNKIETTLKKIRVLRPVVERMVEKAKVENEANKNYLLSMLNDKKLVDRMYKEVGSNFKTKVGGYVRIVRLGNMRADGSESARLEWTVPIVSEEKKLTMLKTEKVKKPLTEEVSSIKKDK